MLLGDRQVAKDEGEGLMTATGDLEFCKQLCSHLEGCKSFAFCGAQCFLKDGQVTPTSESVYNPHCTTYYRSVNTDATTTLAPDSEETPECRRFSSVLVMNQGQQYSGNAEADIHGFAEMTLCTNGIMKATLQVDGGHSEIIATHIHHCESGDSHQTRTAVFCTGPPVVNFCGNNAASLIADGAKYSVACSGYNSTDTSITEDVQGTFIPNWGILMTERVKDIFANPDMYYFNLHSLADFTHWYPGHVGVCRGPLKPETSGIATTTPAPGPVKCFSFYSQMSVNELQKYPGNPDSQASGYASFKLCTNGTLQGQALIFGGTTQLIAMHVQRCEGGDTPQTRTAELCEGFPVLNFCGDNSAELIADGTPYLEACAAYSGLGASHTKQMMGAFVSGTNTGTTLAELLEDMAQNPQLYVFNAHSLASFGHWYPEDQGMARGPMELWTGV